MSHLHTGAAARVRAPRGVSDVFCTASGVRRGCMLAPALFCCAIDWLVRHCSGCFGVDVGGFRLADVGYADGAVLFTGGPARWDCVFRGFEASAAVVGLRTGWHKARIRGVGAWVAPGAVRVGGQAVETVSGFACLGSGVDSDGCSCPGMHGRLGVAGSVVAQLGRVWRRQGLGLSAGLGVYASLVRLVVLYGSETWTMRKVDSA